MRLSLTGIAKFIAVLDVCISLVVIGLLYSEEGNEKIGLLLGINIHEFELKHVLTGTDNKINVFERSSRLKAEEYKNFAHLCSLCALVELVVSVLLFLATTYLLVELAAPWFIQKLVSFLVQVVGLICYITQQPVLKNNVIYTAIITLAITTVTMTIVYKAMQTWPSRRQEGVGHIRLVEEDEDLQNTPDQDAETVSSNFSTNEGNIRDSLNANGLNFVNGTEADVPKSSCIESIDDSSNAKEGAHLINKTQVDTPDHSITFSGVPVAVSENTDLVNGAGSVNSKDNIAVDIVLQNSEQTAVQFRKDEVKLPAETTKSASDSTTGLLAPLQKAETSSPASQKAEDLPSVMQITKEELHSTCVDVNRSHGFHEVEKLVDPVAATELTTERSENAAHTFKENSEKSNVI
ncbi:uncharacterized protein [Periplaneta americana]|uniref:uncharacterized protein n=1 Tax=Periplaneta americana TaxID=6978 RepID=UPI0037E72B87